MRADQAIGPQAMKLGRLAFPMLIVMSLSTIGLPAVRASDTARNSLRHVTELTVVVEEPDEELKDCGLTERMIQTDTELKLRLADVTVSDSTDSWLYVNVNAIKADSLCVYSASIEFQQPVMLLRRAERMLEPTDDELRALVWRGIGSLSAEDHMRMAFSKAATWDKGTVGVVTENRDPETFIRNSVKDLVDIFVNDLLAARKQRKDWKERLRELADERQKQEGR